MYKLLGVNQDHDTCSHCGRKGLKKVVWLDTVDVDGNPDGAPSPYGCNCAATLLRISSLQVWRKAEAHDRKQKADASAVCHEIGDERSVCNWVIEAIGNNGGSIERLCFANGRLSLVSQWAEQQFPHCVLDVRKAR